MRAHIAATLVMLGVLAGLGLHNQWHLAALRSDQEALSRQAVARGILLDPADPVGAIRFSRRPRADREAVAKRVMDDYLASVRRINSACTKGFETPAIPVQSTTDPAIQKRDEMETVEQISALGRIRLRMLVAELSALGGIGDINNSTQEWLYKLPLLCLAKDYPQDALEMILNSPELLQLTCESSDRMKGSGVFVAVSSWAHADPAAVIEWYRGHANRLPDAHRIAARVALIYGTADCDPRFAATLLKESDQTSHKFLGTLITEAETRERRLAMLAVCRELKAMPADDELNPSVIDSFNRYLVLGKGKPEGFGFSTKLIECANLSGRDLEALTLGLERQVAVGEAGRWAEWLAQKLPPEATRDRIRNLMPQWRDEDPEAAAAFAKEHGIEE